MLTHLLVATVLAASAQSTGRMSPTSDVSGNTVKATGATTLRSMRDRFADTVSVLDYGAACDGTTDDSAAFGSAIVAAMTMGRELRLPAATCRTTGQIVLPNDGATPPRQKPLRIIGAGATMSGRGASVANGGSVWDATYNGTLYGKILTTGLGMLEIAGVTFTDSGGGTLPWIYTTNTTLKVHETAFIGSKTGTAADQDAIILGGVQGVEGQGSPEHGFQGYGTVIRDNHFHRVRRAVYGRTYANATVIRDNTVWSNCGSNLAGGAAIEFDSIGGQTCAGNLISGNLIEASNYPYAIKFGAATQNAIIANGIYDTTATTLAGVRFEAGAVHNLLIDGFMTGAVPRLSDASPGPSNVHIPVDSGQATKLGKGGEFEFAATDLVHRMEGNYPTAHYVNKVTQTGAYQQLGGTANNPTMDAYLVASGATAMDVGGWKYYGANQGALQVNGSSFAAVEAPNGDLKLRAKTGSTLWFGDIGGSNAYWQQSTQTLNMTGTSCRVNMSGAGAEITLGATAFASLPASNNGSVRYCSDCTVANPCAGSGTGALAKRLNGAWVCN